MQMLIRELPPPLGGHQVPPGVHVRYLGECCLGAAERPWYANQMVVTCHSFDIATRLFQLCQHMVTHPPDPHAPVYVRPRWME